MAKFNFLRVIPVDLKRYLPQFLEHDPTFAATLESLSKEHEKQRLTLMDITKQFFVKTATWGLSDWEEFVGLEHESADTLQIRRQKILRKLQGSQTVTLEFLTKLVNLYVADGQAVVIDHPDTYSIEILHHGGQITDYEKLRTAISTYIPAHIGYKLVTITKADLEYHGAGTVQCYRKNLVDMSVKYSINVDDSPRYIAGAVVHNYKLIKISGGNRPWLNLQI